MLAWLVWGDQDGWRSHLSPSVNSDGAGRSGTYILIDMVLNKMAKGKAPLSRGLERDALLWQPALPEAWEDEPCGPFSELCGLFAASELLLCPRRPWGGHWGWRTGGAGEQCRAGTGASVP